MKLRRSLALAAATAVLSPVVLMTATVAQAEEGGPSSAVTESAATGGDTKTEPENSVTTPAAEVSTSPATDATSSAPAADDATSAAPAKDTASSSASTSASPTGSASASTSASPSKNPEDCLAGDVENFDEDLSTTLSGLPSKIVAGSGYHAFKLNVKNSGSHSYKRVDLGVFAATMSDDEDDFSDPSNHLTLQYQDPSTGKWNDISVDVDDDAAGYLGYTDVKAKESFSIDLRVAVDKKAPAGFGFAVSTGMYLDDKGNCVAAPDDSFYQFDVLAAGTSAGPVDDSTPKPQGGRKPLPTTKPAGNTEIVPQGHLAETGSSSALPAIALAGGAAVALGLGAMFVVRRRRNEGGNVAV
ncbi:LAETG motif-containing sortase-dependent surface protein [Streptomyces sp. NPDC090119]|uniref:LAETG motif-containing sortase-dependent surface protein n=1 Tax=Streptomyces sp. NPDC090119 TaxID=3365951 RepID=UPI003802805D